MTRKVKFSLSIGISNARQEETFTLEQLGIEEDDYDTEAELEGLLDEEWRRWAFEYIDGGAYLVD